MKVIWKIIGTLGATSFLITGLIVLFDPTCISADFGGGRVSTITCRPDSYGSMSGGAAAFIALLIGLGLLALIYQKEISGYLDSKKVITSDVKNRVHQCISLIILTGGTFQSPIQMDLSK